MPQPPIDVPLNLTTQAVLLYGSWALTAVVLVIALRMGLAERSHYYVLMVLAVLVGAFVEPLYDIAMMLYFYSTAGMATHFTAFGIPQPLWTHSGYVVLYASTAIYIARSAWRGTLTRNRLYAFAGVEVAMSCVFEIVGIRGGAYAYWGPHVFRILDYPVVIAVLEAAQVVVFAVAAAALRARSTRPVAALGLFVLFPCTFLGTNFGAGWPTIIAIHLDTPSTAVTVVGTVLSVALAAVVVRAAAAVVPLCAGPSAPTGGAAEVATAGGTR